MPAPKAVVYQGPERRWIFAVPPQERRRTKHEYADSVAAKQVASIGCVLRRQPGSIVEVPRGTQLQVTYGGQNDTPNVVTLTDAYGGYKGTIKSGSDWVLVRNDGVILADARVTIQFESKVLMDMTFKGTIDLKETFGSSTGQDAYEKYKAGTADPVLRDETGRFFHRLVGSLRFEGGDGTVDDDYADHFTASAEFGRRDKLDLLVREQFFTTGVIFIDKVPHYDPTEINLGVWSWKR